MPPALARDNPAWPDDDDFVGVVAFDCLSIPVSDLSRSIAFYAELFAMRLVAGGDTGRAILGRGGPIRLALLAREAPASVPPMRITAVVDSLDAARGVVWNSGLATLNDPDAAAAAECDAAFAIEDPDGHRIRFVERAGRA